MICVVFKGTLETVFFTWGKIETTVRPTQKSMLKEMKNSCSLHCPVTKNLLIARCQIEVPKIILCIGFKSTATSQFEIVQK